MVLQNNTASSTVPNGNPTVTSSKRTQALLKHLWERRVIYSALSFVLLIFTGVLCYRYSQFTHLLNLGQHLFPHQPGPCFNIPGVLFGAEDLELISTGLVFISTGLKFNTDPESIPWKDRHGQILLFDFKASTKGALPLTLEWKHQNNFNPHGLGSWANGDGTYSLFVVNHLEEESVVERFTFALQQPGVLKHEETTRSHSFHLLSDVAATGSKSFYYTNSFRNRDGGIFQKIELKFSMSWGSVGHCMRHACGKVVGGLRIPSGIAMSANKKMVYISHIGEESIEVYEIVEHHYLQQKQVWPVETAINNINVDPLTGDLWTGGTSVFYKSLIHTYDPTFPCPSQVLHFKLRDGKIIKMREVYSEDGNRFVSLSTSALYYDNKLLIGSAFSRAAMCEVLYTW